VRCAPGRRLDTAAATRRAKTVASLQQGGYRAGHNDTAVTGRNMRRTGRRALRTQKRPMNEFAFTATFASVNNDRN